MSDEQRTPTKTCVGCAWYRVDSHADGTGQCMYPLPMLADDGDDETYAEDHCDATDCKGFMTVEDATLIAECHRKRSLGIAVPWPDVDRLVVLLAGKPLERRKRCGMCGGEGWMWCAVGTMAGQSRCGKCNGTGCQGG